MGLGDDIDDASRGRERGAHSEVTPLPARDVVPRRLSARVLVINTLKRATGDVSTLPVNLIGRVGRSRVRVRVETTKPPADRRRSDERTSARSRGPEPATPFASASRVSPRRSSETEPHTRQRLRHSRSFDEAISTSGTRAGSCTRSVLATRRAGERDRARRAGDEGDTVLVQRALSGGESPRDGLSRTAKGGHCG